MIGEGKGVSGCVQYYCSTWDSFFRYVRAERPSLWGQLWVFLKVGAPSPCQFEGERGKKNAFSQEYVGQAKLWLLLFFLLVSALFCVNPEEEYFFSFSVQILTRTGVHLGGCFSYFTLQVCFPD